MSFLVVTKDNQVQTDKGIPTEATGGKGLLGRYDDKFRNSDPHRNAGYRESERQNQSHPEFSNFVKRMSAA